MRCFLPGYYVEYTPSSKERESWLCTYFCSTNCKPQGVRWVVYLIKVVGNMVQVLVPYTRVLATVESTLQGGTFTLCDMHPNMLYFGNMHIRVVPNYAYF
jgi:hypothetical protein